MEGVTWGMSFIPSCYRSFGWRGGARVAMGTAQHSVAAWAPTSLLPQSSSPSTPECQGLFPRLARTTGPLSRRHKRKL